MTRNYQALLCLVLAFAGCSKPETTPAEPDKAAQDAAETERKMALLEAKIELADVCAKRDKLINLRHLILTNGQDFTPEQEAEHNKTLKGLEEIEQRLRKKIAENE